MKEPMHRRARHPNYDLKPFVACGTADERIAGWDAIATAIIAAGPRTIAIEAYPGTVRADLEELCSRLDATRALDTADAFKPESEIDSMLAPDLTDDPVFGHITQHELRDFFDPEELDRIRVQLASSTDRVIICGPGAALVGPVDVLVYADMPRWEIQQRQRRGEVANLGASNFAAPALEKYKRGYFVDWRVGDRHKNDVFDRVDFFLDTTDRERPAMVTGATLRRGLARAARRPFRVVPLFDPAPWGGQWMRNVCRLPSGPPNYGWCFDCVPEENTLLLGFGETRFAIPALDLVLRHPRELLGAAVEDRFGGEFPIRFDFLDTIEGGNLSLQVHPLTAYMREQVGVGYTQDESYYILDAEPDATVYLGAKTDIDPKAMFAELRKAESEGLAFTAETYVNRFPARRHDHFLIPAGTLHCSGAGSLVLEISATPYIFTFKLWDWGRMGLDGRPRPIHLDHGERNVCWERDRAYAERCLINRTTDIGEGNGWRAERTGLHETEFIETHRHWFTATVPHDTGGSVNVLNLVEGEEAVVESLDGGFEPFTVHYAETFIVPASVGAYTIRPTGTEHEQMHATIKAFVRDTALRSAY